MKKPGVKDLAKIEWHYVHRRIRSPFFVYLLFVGAAYHFFKKIKIAYEMWNFLYLDREIFLSEKNWGRLELEAIRETKRSASFFIKFANTFYRLDEQISKLSKKINFAVGKLSDQQLSGKLKQYSDLSLMASASMIVPMVLEKYLEEIVVAAIKRKFPAENGDLIQAVSLPVKPTSAQQAELSLLEIALRKKKGSNVEKQIAEHIKKHGWLKNVDFTGNFYTVAEIEKEISKLMKNNPVQKVKKYFVAQQAHLRNIKKVRSVFKNDRKILKLIDSLREAIFFRSWRTERFYRNAQYLEEFFAELAKRVGCKKQDIFFLTSPEIIDLLRRHKTADKKLLVERKKGYLLFTNGNDCFLYSGKFLSQAKRGIKLIKHKNEEEGIIKGQAAYPGIILGKARVIKDKKDFHLVKQGEILVTPSTTPDYVPILKKVKAIVTDEGGVLSHASVISRELKIPCVIGTKNATKIIKTGDLVEVNASLGIIKILKK